MSLQNLLMRIAKNIQKLRKAKKMTQAKLAQLSDLEIRTIQRAESGKHTNGLHSLEKIANVLTIDIEQLMFKNL